MSGKAPVPTRKRRATEAQKPKTQVATDRVFWSMDRNLFYQYVWDSCFACGFITNWCDCFPSSNGLPCRWICPCSSAFPSPSSALSIGSAPTSPSPHCVPWLWRLTGPTPVPRVSESDGATRGAPTPPVEAKSEPEKVSVSGLMRRRKPSASQKDGASSTDSEMQTKAKRD